MTSERKPRDEQAGFETSSELRHDESPVAPAPEPYAEAPLGRSPRGISRVVVLAVIIVAVGFLIYLLVTLL